MQIVGGITLNNCSRVFQDVWQQSLDMLEEGLKNSKAQWHIVNTHFPGPSIASGGRIQALHQAFGIDLIFTGHTHFQTSGTTKGINWIISGGGGGVTSDAKPSLSGYDTSYGFVDFTITRDALKFDMLSWGGMDGGKQIIMSSKTINARTSTAMI